MLQEFKEFALRGNMLDLAIGIIIGAAFNGIVASLVGDIIMPALGFLFGGLDFNNYFFQLTGEPQATYDAAKAAGATIGYGAFLTLLLNFVLVAFAVFMLVKGINRLRRKEEAKPVEVAAVPRNEMLLEEIRDLLAKKV